MFEELENVSSECIPIYISIHIHSSKLCFALRAPNVSLSWYKQLWPLQARHRHTINTVYGIINTVYGAPIPTTSGACSTTVRLVYKACPGDRVAFN